MLIAIADVERDEAVIVAAFAVDENDAGCRLTHVRKMMFGTFSVYSLAR